MRSAGIFVLSTMLWAPAAGAQDSDMHVVLNDQPTLSLTASVDEVQCGGAGRWIAMYNPYSGGEIRILETNGGHVAARLRDPSGQQASRIAADPVDDRVALGFFDGGVSVLDVRSEKEVWRWRPPTLAGSKSMLDFRALRFSRDGARLDALVTVTTQRLFQLPKYESISYSWEATTGKMLESRSFDANVSLMSEDGQWLASMRIAVFHPAMPWTILDRKTGQPVGPEIKGMVMAMHSAAHRALVRSMDGSLNPLSLIDPATGQVVKVEADGVSQGIFSPDGKQVLLTGSFGWRVIDAESGRLLFPGGRDQTLGSAQFLPDGKHFIARDSATGLKLIATSDTEPAQYRQIGQPVDMAEVQKAYAMYAANDDGLQRRDDSFQPVISAGAAAAFTGDGRWLLVRGVDGQLEFFDTATGNKMPFRVPTSSDSAQPLSTAADGRYLYVKSQIRAAPGILEKDLKTRGLLYIPKHQIVEQPVIQKTFSTEKVDTASGRIVTKRRFENVLCLSAGGEFAVEYTTDKKGKATATLKNVEGRSLGELVGMGLRLQAGCSIRQDGEYVAVASAEGKAPKAGWPGEQMSDGGFCTRFGCQKAHYDIYNVVARQVVASLEDGQTKKAAKLPFAASDLRWSADGRFVFAGGSGVSAQHGPVSVWEVATGKQLQVFPNSENATAMGMSPDGSLMLLAPAGRSQFMQLMRRDSLPVEARDVTTGLVRFLLKGAVTQPDSLTFGPNGKTIVGLDLDGALRIWRMADGAMLGQLRILPGGDWLVYTPDGSFDGSPKGWSLLSWRDSSEKLQTAGGEIYFNEFYRPGLLADLLEGKLPPVSRSLPNIDRRQPAVSVAASMGPDGNAEVTISASEAPASGSNTKGSGVRDLRLFRNGLLVKAWRGALQVDGSGSFHASVHLPVTGGNNHFTAYAFNHDNVRSAEAASDVTVPGAPRPGVAWIVAVGINQYANPQFNLKYAVPDADDLAREVAGRQLPLGQFAAVHTVTLRDGEATGANIRLALSRLAGENSGKLPAGAAGGLEELAAMGPEDTLIFYFAGHGAAYGDRFYLIPHDLGYEGARSEARGHIEQILAHGISDEDLERALEPMQARHIMVIIDACQSGQALESDDDRRGPMNSRGLAQLAWEKGISVLAASQAYQAAVESDARGHGYLTYALVEEGLKTAVADTAPTDGNVTENEWLEYAVRRVPQLQIEAMDQARQNKRVLVLELGPKGSNSQRIQSPRLFTRRDAPDKPLTMTAFPPLQ